MNKSYLEPEEVKLMEDAATCLRDRLLIRLLFRLGCRISEALVLSIKDTDLMQGLVTIVHLKNRPRLFCPRCQRRLGKSHEFCPNCGNKVDRKIKQEQEHRRLRVLPLDSETIDILSDYINRGGPVFKNGARLIFGINRHRAWQIIRDCAERAALPKLLNPDSGKLHNVSPHRLRDAFAVHAMKADDSGDGLRLLQEHLGHATFNTTAKYRKIAGEEHREWYQKLWQEK
jgi:integrase/recombinase XerD